MAYAIENARYQWDEGERRLRQAEPEHAAALDHVLWQIVDELRKRLGSTFTLEELATLYNEGTDWADDIASRREAGLDTSAVVDAAFARYAREAWNFSGGRYVPEDVAREQRRQAAAVERAKLEPF
jgi:hypothetical protein